MANRSIRSIVWLAGVVIAQGCGGGGGASNQDGGQDGDVPVVSFSPVSGPVGTLLTLTGVDFSSVTSVTVASVSAVIVNSSASSVTALVMPGSTNGQVSVATSTSSLVASGTFTVTATGTPATQQGNKLIGSGYVGAAAQGYAGALSADGNTALVGGEGDNGDIGAAWVYTRMGSAWTQQGDKLVGMEVSGFFEGDAVALSADGNTALVGGDSDNNGAGASWVFTRTNGVWSQQGTKLVGTGAVGAAAQGTSVALSADGNTALIGGYQDMGSVGAAWVFTRAGGVWTQQGTKLVGTGAVGNAEQSYTVALSADGNTAVVGGFADHGLVGAIWIFTRSGGVWTQQGGKLAGANTTGMSRLGGKVAISADGNTVVAGASTDNANVGGAWVFTRTGSAWTQQGNQLIGSGAIGAATQGYSVALSADGNTALVGGNEDNGEIGATWVFTRANGVWSQLGSKLVGTGSAGAAEQGDSLALSSDGTTALVGGSYDFSDVGASWIFAQ